MKLSTEFKYIFDLLIIYSAGLSKFLGKIYTIEPFERFCLQNGRIDDFHGMKSCATSKLIHVRCQGCVTSCHACISAGEQREFENSL
jgi:hypothetical protein